MTTGGGRGETCRPFRDAKIEQQAAVLVRRHVEGLENRRIAGRLPPEHVLARREMRERMEEEQPLGKCRDGTEPEVSAFEVLQLVTERHALLLGAERVETLRRQ